MSRLTPSLLALDKGLDLQTAKIIAPEGSVFDTINYEQVDFQGQKRIDGYTRYDGSALSAVDEYRVMVVDSINGPSTDRDLLFYEGKLLGVIGQQEDTTLRYVVIDHNIEVFPDTAVQVVGYSVNGESSSWTANVISDVSGQEDSLDTSIHYEHLLFIMSSLRSKVEELPGPIAGLHWFQDRLYAVAGVQKFVTLPYIVGDLPDAFKGATGTYQYSALSGLAPYTFSISEGALPNGASMDANGLVTYTYITPGDYSWTVRVVDNNGRVAMLADSSTIAENIVGLLELTPYTGNNTFPRTLGSLNTEGSGFALVSATTGTVGALVGSFSYGAAKGTISLGSGAVTAAPTLSFGNGVTWGNVGQINGSGTSYIQYLLKKHPRFCSVVQYTGTGAVQMIEHQLTTVPGAIAIFAPGTTNSPLYHRTAGPSIRAAFGGIFTAEVTNTSTWNNTSPTDSTFMVGADNAVNALGTVYTAVCFAHDTGDFGLVQCGGYVGNGNVFGPVVNLGWNPKMVIVLSAVRDSTSDPCILDAVTSPGFIGNELPMTLGAQTNTTPTELISLNGTGFSVVSSSARLNTNNRNYRYIAFRGDS